MSAYLARTFHMSMTSAQIVTWLGLVCIILLIVSGGRILHKAGDRWWKILIPIYGIYCLYKAADSTGLFWGTIGLSVATTIITRLRMRGIICTCLQLNRDTRGESTMDV